MKRTFLQLAKDYEEQDVRSWFASEKLDGIRCWWDGGVSRGIPVRQVPWANTANDHPNRHDLISTGLWSRYAKTIQAPSSFVDKLPSIPLDGELYAGHKRMQYVTSVVKDQEPGPGWKDITFMCFASPLYKDILYDGDIEFTIGGKKTKIHLRKCLDWLESKRVTITKQSIQFKRRYEFLQNLTSWNDVCKLVPQSEIPMKGGKEAIDGWMKMITEQGGEGLMFTCGQTFYTPARIRLQLKYKLRQDAEAVVVGYRWGEQTDHGSKHLGRMGSLRVIFQGRVFDLSGFTDEERELSESDLTKPGKLVDEKIFNPMFPRGSTVTFEYRELTDDGLPKEASYLRKRSCL